MMNPTFRLLTGLLAAGLLSGCSQVTPQPAWKLAVAGDGPGEKHRVNIADLVVANLPKSRYGNPAQYEVFGQEYTVLDSAEGFTQRGTASWYGKKFHGRRTSSGEIYDMHQLTAAHKHLPLPTYVRVTRVDNGQSVVVKVNDRGPFVGDRVIDLSYAAATKLGMAEAGKAEVFIEALSRHEPAQQASRAPATGGAGNGSAAVVVSPSRASSAPDFRDPVGSGPAAGSRFLQVGAYTDEINAMAMQRSLRKVLNSPALIYRDASRQLYLVRVGPLQDQGMMRQAQQSLSRAGIESYEVTD